jgi:hypothetical protein
VDFPSVSFLLTLALCSSTVRSLFNLDCIHFLAAWIKAANKGVVTNLMECYSLGSSFPKIDVSPGE